MNAATGAASPRLASLILVLALFAVSAGVLLGSDRGDRCGRCAPASMQTITVGPGDTLWELAARHGPPGTDVRATIRAIFRTNRLTSTRLVVGQRLLLPAPP